MKSKLMFIRGVYEYHINGRDIYMLSESHQEFKSKISGCKSKGYKLIDEYVRSFDNPVVILELSDKFEKKYEDSNYYMNLRNSEIKGYMDPGFGEANFKCILKIPYFS